ncbi:hypothetical protein D3C76_1240880 [compost metagenome]
MITPVLSPQSGPSQGSCAAARRTARPNRPYNAYASNAPPKARAAHSPLLMPSQALPSKVPTKIIASIGHSLFSRARKCPPKASCQRLVRVEGTISKAAACAGDIAIPSRPMAMVGRPRPITPFTAPASTKVARTSSVSAGPIS